jgi:hypothetical protein
MLLKMILECVSVREYFLYNYKFIPENLLFEQGRVNIMPGKVSDKEEGPRRVKIGPMKWVKLN